MSKNQISPTELDLTDKVRFAPVFNLRTTGHNLRIPHFS